MANGSKIPWYVWLPGWIAGFGTVALAIFAFFTLDPIIENLQIKKQNKQLAEEAKKLVDQRDSQERQLMVTKANQEAAEARLTGIEGLMVDLNDQVQQKQEDLKRAEERREKAEQRREKADARLGTLLDQLDKREKERRKLETANTRLAGENERSKQQLETVNKRITGLQTTLSRAQEELDEAYRAQRFYILETIVTKVKAKTEPEAITPIIMMGFKGKKISYDLSASDIISGIFDTIIEPKQQITGRDYIEELMTLREFNLLREKQRREFKTEIRQFMDSFANTFNAPLRLKPGLLNRVNNAKLFLLRLNTAKKKEDPIEIEPSKPSRIPTEEDIKLAKESLEKIKKERSQGIESMKFARLELHKALDLMLSTLVKNK